MTPGFPTADPALNAVLHELVAGIQGVLGAAFIGAYLQGSFAAGDWDAYSDVDFVVVIEHDVPEGVVPTLQAMHGRIYDSDCQWAKHLEGSYFPRELIRRGDPARQPLLYLDNGSRQLIKSDHCNTLVVRWVTREYGISLAGPPPDTLIDSVSADDLRDEVRATMHEWGEQFLADPERMNNRWYQAFVVLSYCRMLQTLQTGRIDSKWVGAEWAKSALDRRWSGLIQRAWDERPNPTQKARQPADPGELQSTLEFIGYALEVSLQDAAS